MSSAVLAAAFKVSLEPKQKLVALILADHADPTGENIYPSLDRVADMTSLSKQSVRRAIAALCADGLLILVAEASRYKPNEYRFDMAEVEARGTRQIPLKKAGVPKRGEQGYQNEPGRGTTLVPEPRTKNLELEPRTNNTPPLIPPHGGACFEDFWKAYPRHESRKGALEQWQRLKVTPELLQTMLAAIEVQKQSPQWRDGKIVYAVRWLRDRRWDDEPFLPAAANNNGVQPWVPHGIDLRTEEEKHAAQVELDEYYRQHPRPVRPRG